MSVYYYFSVIFKRKRIIRIKSDPSPKYIVRELFCSEYAITMLC